MKTEHLHNPDLQELERLLTYYQTMADTCSDTIKQLIGYTPDDFSFTFSIKNKAVVTIPITQENASFCLGTFMAWAAHYKRQWRETSDRYNGLTAQVA